ncbi:hypothetical protein QC589_02830 [Halomonas elongata]|uniref:hypothetical protein n=1 Tax=Halomonas elongata TaxID=2746 RepID=UPI00335A2744
MEKIVEPSQIKAIWRAKRYLRFWPYLKWINPIVGGAVFGYSFTAITSSSPQADVVFGIIHPAIVAVAALVVTTNIPWRRRAEERQLLLDLAREHGNAVD